MNRPKRIIIEESVVLDTEKGKVLLEPGAMIEVCESNKPSKNNPVDYNQHKICVDTVKNPLKAMLLGGPSQSEAERILRDKFGYSTFEIQKLKSTGKIVNENRKRLLRPYKRLYESRPRRRKNLISESKKRKFQKEFRERVLRRIQEQRAPKEYKVKVRTSSYSWGD